MLQQKCYITCYTSAYHFLSTDLSSNCYIDNYRMFASNSFAIMHFAVVDKVSMPTSMRS